MRPVLAMVLLGLVSCGQVIDQGVSKDNVEPRSAVEEKTSADWVQPFWGTAGDHGQLHAAASLPFGLLQVGPETPGRPHSGYDFNERRLEGFSHNRTSGVGCRGSGGSVLLKASLSDVSEPISAIDKSSEFAEPGYYRVDYGDPLIRAEMTVAEGVGIQRYGAPATGDLWLHIDLSHAHHKFYSAAWQPVSLGSTQRIQGFVEAATVCDIGKFKTHFSLASNLPVQDIKRFDGHKLALLFHVNEGDLLEVRTGFSAIDSAAAEAKRAALTADFETIKANAKAAWQQALSTVEVQGSDDKMAMFYSNLYRAYLSPQLQATQGTNYRAADGQVYTAEGRDHYHGWSVWDTFRTKFPLLTLTQPERMQDIIASMAALYSQGKAPWASQTEPLPTVRTEHSGIVLLDAWRKGIQPVEAAKLLPLLAQEADQAPRKSPDQILEAAYDDWAVANWALIAGDKTMAAEYAQRAKAYRPLWQQKFKHMGDSADIMHGDGLYEGTLWQYRWFVPFDIDWLVNELGGEQAFTDQLAYFFEQHLFNMGNQPDIQTPFLFNAVGQAWRSQQVLDTLLNRSTPHWYGTHEKKPLPYISKAFVGAPAMMIPEMDDDAGTMTSWYVFASLGLYPVAPGEAAYSIHTPQLDGWKLHLPNGKQFAVSVSQAGAPYIQSAMLNGKSLKRAWLHHEEIMQGGALVLETGTEPNSEWGSEQPYRTRLDSLMQSEVEVPQL